MSKILVVDDSKLNLMIMFDILNKEGFDVSCIDSSLTIINDATKLKPDVILLDLLLPGLDGFDVCKLLKSNDLTNTIPIIIVTADSNPISIKRALGLGAFDYIRKPFEPIEVIARVRSAIKLKEYETKLINLALRDPLTGLYNRTAFMELFDKELSNQKRRKFSLATLMIDIDDFKHINDTYGHQCGDYVLQDLSRILSNSVRTNDIVSRYGGEEFCVVLTDISKTDAINVCERLRLNVEDNIFMYSNQQITVTISIGVSLSSNCSNLSKTELINLADKKLYLAKNSGKNTVKIA